MPPRDLLSRVGDRAVPVASKSTGAEARADGSPPAYTKRDTFDARRDADNGRAAPRTFLPRQTPAERARQNVASTYAFAAGGLGLVGAGAHLASQSALMAFPVATPICASIAAVAGFGVSHAQAPNSTPQLASWAAGCASLGVGMAGLTLFAPALLVNAGIATGALLVALSGAAIVLPRDTVHAWAGPLSAGLTALACLAFVQCFLPAHLALAATAHSVQLYGGFAVFSGLFVAESQDLWDAAESNERFAPAPQSIQIMLTTLNLFVRMLQRSAEAEARAGRDPRATRARAV